MQLIAGNLSCVGGLDLVFHRAYLDRRLASPDFTLRFRRIVGDEVWEHDLY